jgi:hypothetical protein
MFLHSSGSPKRAALLCLVLCLASAVVSSGCNRITRTRQCRALIAQVNPVLDEITTITGTGGGGAGGQSGVANAALRGGTSALGGMPGAGGTPSRAYIAAASRYEQLAKQLGPMEFASEDMAKSVAEYANVLSNSAQTLRTLAGAIDSNNYVEVDRSTRELDRLAAREHAAIARIDTWCQPE